jgi:ribosomal-protein-alanine N-acetyltransferase
MLAHPGSVALLASAGTPRQIGAFALAQVAADEAEILTIGVAPAWQRQGVATKLLDGVKRAAVRAGAPRLFLEVAQSNGPAIALYGRNGFSEAGRREDYYTRPDGSREDALILRAVMAS